MSDGYLFIQVPIAIATAFFTLGCVKHTGDYPPIRMMLWVLFFTSFLPDFGYAAVLGAFALIGLEHSDNDVIIEKPWKKYRISFGDEE